MRTNSIKKSTFGGHLHDSSIELWHESQITAAHTKLKDTKKRFVASHPTGQFLWIKAVKGGDRPLLSLALNGVVRVAWKNPVTFKTWRMCVRTCLCVVAGPKPGRKNEHQSVSFSSEWQFVETLLISNSKRTGHSVTTQRVGAGKNVETKACKCKKRFRVHNTSPSMVGTSLKQSEASYHWSNTNYG